MADLGAIAVIGNLTSQLDDQSPDLWPSSIEKGNLSAGLSGQVPAGYAFTLQLTSELEPLFFGYTPSAGGFVTFKSGRDDAVGNPLPPSQKQSRPGVLKRLLIPVTAGARTISVDVLIADERVAVGPFPRLVVKAGQEAGLHADVVATAAGISGWQTLTCSFTANRAGVVEVWREQPSFSFQRDVWWDNLTVS